jgi:hypothetical protein
MVALAVIAAKASLKERRLKLIWVDYYSLIADIESSCFYSLAPALFHLKAALLAYVGHFFVMFR